MKIKELLKEDFKIDIPDGRANPAVADIQKALVALGYDVGPTGIDGVRGPYTRAAVKKFQADVGVTVDGDPGPETVSALNKVLAYKPEIADKLTHSTSSDVKYSGTGSKVDTSAIQDPDFNTKLKKVADALGVDDNALRTIIKHESGGDPTAHDPWGVSAGLIGFTSSTARHLGTTKEAILNMSAIDQLDLVYRYYKMVGAKPGMDAGQLYMLTFMPAYATAPDDTVLGQEGGGELGHTGLSMDKIWKQNPLFSGNGPKHKSGSRTYFTVGDVKKSVGG